jgi:hypothetical protein
MPARPGALDKAKIVSPRAQRGALSFRGAAALAAWRALSHMNF